MKGYQIQKVKGNGCEIGLHLGCQLKGRLRAIIDHFLKAVDRAYHLDFDRMKQEASAWLEKLPEEYLVEVESLAYGSGVKLERIAQWLYSERYIAGGCTGFIICLEDAAWVGRNYDHAGPGLWRSVTIIEKEARIPVVLFGQEGALFSLTGYNSRKLWVHCNRLPAWDMPDPDEKAIPSFVFVRMALESCSHIGEIEKLLQAFPRDSGMCLFVVDGKSNTYAVYECTCKGYVKRQGGKPYIAGANHYVATPVPAGFFNGDPSSVNRLNRMESLLAAMKIKNPCRDLIRVLADPEVEQNLGDSGTVYANLACPAKGLYYFACNGFPAASRAAFEEVVLI